MQQMRREEALLEQSTKVLGMCAVPASNDIDIRNGNAWKQFAPDVLVRCDTPSNLHEEDNIRFRNAKATWTQEVSADLGDDAQAEECNGKTR